MDDQDGTQGAEALERDTSVAVQTNDLTSVLRHLRGLALPCFPPVGVGSFDILYASDREIVVWYSPAREDHRAGEVAIPTTRLAAAWSALTDGEPLDEAALERCGEGAAGGRWLLALLAQLPGVRVEPDPLILAWSPRTAEPEPAPAATAEPAPKKPRRSGAGAAKPRRPRTKAEPAAVRSARRSAREA